MADAPENTQLWYLQGLLRQNGCKYGQGDDWQCPAHDDDNASLGVSQGEKGVVIHCAAGCHPTEVLSALGTTWPIVLAFESGDPAFREAPSDAPNARTGQKSLESLAEEHGGFVGKKRYEYRDAEGNLARVVFRFDFADGTKDIRQKIHDKKAVLYHYALVRKGIEAGLPVYVCEGEKAADRLNSVAGKGEQRRAVVTCSPGGCKGWTGEHGRLLDGARRVVVIADNDEAGFKYARDVVDSILGGTVSVVRSATDGKGDDICEHLDAGFKIKDLRPVDLDDVLNRVHAESVEAPDDDVIGLKLPDVIVSEKPDVDPTSIVWPSPNQPLEVARKLAQNITYGGHGTIRRWRQKWFYWTPELGHYDEFEPERWFGQIAEILRPLKCYNSADPPEQVPWNPKPSTVDAVLKMLAGLEEVNVPSTTRPGVRLSTDEQLQMISLSNGVLDLAPDAALRLTRPSPDFFTLHALPFAYDPSAQCARWEQFLRETWPDDPESVALLQEWFGYVVSEDMHQEKFLALYGVPGSGKTTIDNVLRALLGDEAVTSTSLAQLGSRFGKVGLDTKKLAISGDSRWNGKENDETVQTILSITGRTAIDVEPKGKDHYTAMPTARLMLVANERPALRDPQNALMRRLLLLETRHSCPPASRDSRLLEKLVSELPGILNWALCGLQRLRERGVFTVVASTEDEYREIARDQSDIAAFIEDRCTLGPDEMVTTAEFADAYRQWREENALPFPPSNNKIGRELRARFPELRKDRHGNPAKGEQAWTWFGVSVNGRHLKVRVG